MCWVPRRSRAKASLLASLGLLRTGVTSDAPFGGRSPRLWQAKRRGRYRPPRAFAKGRVRTFLSDESRSDYPAQDIYYTIKNDKSKLPCFRCRHFV